MSHRLASALVISVLAIACSKSRESPAASSPPPAPPPTAPARPAIAPAPTPDAAEVDCADACTSYAVCWEEQHAGQDFHGGGACETACEDKKPADRAAWAAKLKAGGCEAP